MKFLVLRGGLLGQVFPTRAEFASFQVFRLSSTQFERTPSELKIMVEDSFAKAVLVLLSIHLLGFQLPVKFVDKFLASFQHAGYCS